MWLLVLAYVARHIKWNVADQPHGMEQVPPAECRPHKHSRSVGQQPTRADPLQAAAQHCIAPSLQIQHDLTVNLAQRRIPAKVGKCRAGI